MTYLFPSQLVDADAAYPDWRKAPEWAKWWAADGDEGPANWYRLKPKYDKSDRYWHEEIGDTAIASSKASHPYPGDSLVYRPKGVLMLDIDGTLVPDNKSSVLHPWVYNAANYWKKQYVQPVLVTNQGGWIYKMWLENLAPPSPDWAAKQLSDWGLPDLADIKLRIGWVAEKLTVILGIKIPAYVSLGYRFKSSGNWLDAAQFPHLLDHDGNVYEEASEDWYKPNTGMFKKIKEDYPGFDILGMVGDMDSDKEFAQNCQIPYQDQAVYFEVFKDILTFYYNPNFVLGQSSFSEKELIGLDQEKTLLAFERNVKHALENWQHLREVRFGRRESLSDLYHLGSTHSGAISPFMMRQLDNLLASWNWLVYKGAEEHAKALAARFNPIVLAYTIARNYNVEVPAALAMVVLYRR